MIESEYIVAARASTLTGYWWKEDANQNGKRCGYIGINLIIIVLWHFFVVPWIAAVGDVLVFLCFFLSKCKKIWDQHEWIWEDYKKIVCFVHYLEEGRGKIVKEHTAR